MKLFDVLMDEFEDEGGTGGAPVPENVDESYAQQPQDDSSTTSATPVVIPDMAAFADTLAQSLRQVMPQPQAAPQAPAMTDEEFRKATGYYAVSKQDIEEQYGQPPDGADVEKWYSVRQAAMQRQLDGMSQHTLKVMKHMMDYQLGEQLRPYQALLNQQKQDSTKRYVSEIAAGNEGLIGREFLVEQAISVLQKANYARQGEAKDREAILRTAEAIGKRFDPNFSLRAQNSASNGQRARGNMPGAMNGAGGGAGSHGGNKNSGVAALFS